VSATGSRRAVFAMGWKREPAAEILSKAKDLAGELWRALRDSNLRRFAGVWARSRNPEQSEGSGRELWRAL